MRPPCASGRVHYGAGGGGEASRDVARAPVIPAYTPRMRAAWVVYGFLRACPAPRYQRAPPTAVPPLPPPRAKPAIAAIPDLESAAIALAEKAADKAERLDQGRLKRVASARALAQLEAKRLPPGALAMLRSLGPRCTRAFARASRCWKRTTIAASSRPRSCRHVSRSRYAKATAGGSSSRYAMLHPSVLSPRTMVRKPFTIRDGPRHRYGGSSSSSRTALGTWRNSEPDGFLGAV